jgi:predicted acetyltransferase
MPIEIRQPAPDELRAAMEAAEAAFGDSLDDEDWERESKALPAERTLAAYDDGRPVGLAGAYEFTLSIPGGELPCAGVTWVGVLPSHRRRGILRDFMRRQLEDAREWGEPIAALWASESVIYGRFGYGVAVPSVAMKAEKARFALRDDAGPEGTVRLVDGEAALELFPPVYERVRAERAGFLSRDERWWKEHKLADPESWRRGSSKKFYVAVELDGSVEGYAVYRLKNEWEDGMPKGEVRVIEALASSARAERELWRFLFGIDLMTHVRAYYLDPASALFVNVRDPRGLGLRLTDGLWLRLVDIDAALQARTYGDAEPVVLEVTDEFCPWNAGRYRIGADAGRTKAKADLALDAADLASAYLGGIDVHQLVHAGRAQELRDGAAERASRLFRTTLPPYTPEEF